jgi:hypothetical protein
MGWLDSQEVHDPSPFQIEMIDDFVYGEIFSLWV